MEPNVGANGEVEGDPGMSEGLNVGAEEGEAVISVPCMLPAPARASHVTFSAANTRQTVKFNGWHLFG